MIFNPIIGSFPRSFLSEVYSEALKLIFEIGVWNWDWNKAYKNENNQSF